MKAKSSHGFPLLDFQLVLKTTAPSRQPQCFPEMYTLLLARDCHSTNMLHSKFNAFSN
jgi:hypothetical protein